MANILITGGTGFIGTHLSKRLTEEGHSVKLLARHKSNGVIFADLKSIDPSKKLTAEFDIVIHLASIVRVDEMLSSPASSIKNNVDSTLAILEDIRLNNLGCLFVLASSDKVYGKSDKKKVREDDKCLPADPYGCSKLICENLVQMYNNSYGLAYVIIRSGNVFGPSQGAGLFIPSVMKKICQGDNIITVGSLESRRNFVYISDLVEAFILALKKRECGTFNIMAYSKKMLDVSEEIRKSAKKILGRDVSFHTSKKLCRPTSLEADFTMDCSRAENILKWKPKVSFSEAIYETFQSYARDAK